MGFIFTKIKGTLYSIQVSPQRLIHLLYKIILNLIECLRSRTIPSEGQGLRLWGHMSLRQSEVFLNQRINPTVTSHCVVYNPVSKRQSGITS